MSTNQNKHQKDSYFMRLALQQASKALGNTKENPAVGCVIVKNNHLISAGYTSSNGRPHAEKNAIDFSKTNPRDSDLYVTLEPCSHYGKSPPCVKSIVNSKIKKVFFSINDPDLRSFNKCSVTLRKRGVVVNNNVLKDEIKIEKERVKDIKLFLRQEQALIRKEQAEKQRQFLKQLQLEKQIEKFRIREVKELEKLERISLKEKREDYSSLQDRIEKLKAKYRIIRDQKIRERVEALGVKIQEDDDRETLLRKEKEYTIVRQKIELSLESFYRSASSLVFQLNKRHITRHMSIFRCIDRRFETGEIFIKWDESNDEDWLLLIYINNNSLDEGIVIEDKSNPEKNLSHEFKSNEIFKASDMMVDALTQLIARTRGKKLN